MKRCITLKTLIALTHLKPSDVSRAGKKACNLAFLSRSGFNVPAGAVIPVQEYDKALKACAMIASAQTLPASALRRVCADIARHLETFSVSSDLSREIDLFISGFGGRWIVRSSSTDEDGNLCSCAGIFSSIADNNDSLQVLESVRRVWKSFWSEEAFLYREIRHLSHFGAGMAVIIQRQIEAFSSGVVFTRHPVTDQNILVINAHRGAGEELVQGRTTPFSMEIDRGGAGVPSLKTICCEGEAPLDEKTLLELAALAVSMEHQFRYPLDMEWVYSEEFFIVQARPLTGLQMEWTTEPVSEFMGERLTALSADLFRDYMEKHFTAFYRELAIMPASGRVFDVFNGVIYASKGVLKRVETLMADEGNREGISVRTGQMMEMLPRAVEQYRQQMEALQVMSIAGLTPAGAWDLLQRVWKLFCQSDPAVKMTYLLDNLLGYLDRFSEGERFRELLADHALLEGQSDFERFQHQLITLIEESSGDEMFAGWIESSGALPEPEPVRQFISSQSSWCASPFELAEKRLVEDSAQICTILRALQKREGREQFIRNQSEQRKRRQEALRELHDLRNRHAADEKGGPAACVEWILYLQQEREHHRRYTYMATALLRKLFLIVGADLESRAFLTGDQGREDIFHLTLDEIKRIRLSSSISDWIEYTMNSRNRWVKERDDVFPGEFSGFSPKAVPSQLLNMPEGCEAVIAGMALSRGSAAGTARVAESGRVCEAISPGDILVVQNCEPYWALYFPLIAGFIAECGGTLSHAAILAREYQIPAVSGITAATKTIKSGDLVAIDGEKGTVMIKRQPVE